MASQTTGPSSSTVDYSLGIRTLANNFTELKNRYHQIRKQMPDPSDMDPELPQHDRVAFLWESSEELRKLTTDTFYNELQFFSTASDLYKTDLKKFISAPLKTTAKVQKCSLDMVGFLGKEMIFFRRHVEFCNNYLDFSEAYANLEKAGNRFCYPEKSYRRFIFNPALMAPTSAFLLYLRVTSAAKFSYSNLDMNDEKILSLLRQEAKSSDPDVAKLAKVLLDVNVYQVNYQSYRSDLFLDVNGHIPQSVIDLYVVRHKFTGVSNSLICQMMPGMISCMKQATEGFSRWRQAMYVEYDAKKTFGLIDETFVNGIKALVALDQSNYFQLQSSLIAQLITKCRVESIGKLVPGGPDITSKDVQEIYSKISGRVKTIAARLSAFQAPQRELLLQASSKPVRSKKSVKAPTKRAQAPSSKQLPLPATTSVSEACSSTPLVEAVPLIPQPHPNIERFRNGKKLIYDRRIVRWLNCPFSKIENVRNFEDRGELNYQQLSPEDLESQWRFHRFSPLVDRVLGDKALRDTYSIKTETGRALVVELHRSEGEVRKRGVITYGFSPSSGYCIHRHFKQATNEQILGGGVSKIIASSIPELSAHEQKLQEIAESLPEVLAEDFIGDEFEYDPQSRIFSVIDKICQMRICIFPLSV